MYKNIRKLFKIATYSFFAQLMLVLLIGCSENQQNITNPEQTASLSKINSLHLPSVPSLGDAVNFAVLGGTGDVTLTNSVVTGDVGHFPGTSLVVNTGSTVNGTENADAEQAHYDFLNAYTSIENLTCETTLTGTLANVTLTPGVYCFDAAATLTGVLTLDAQGDENAVWIFKIGVLGTGALTGTGFSVVMADGGSPCNVYWWVAQAATLTTSNFQGTILAGGAITVTGGTFNGNALSKADVTLTDAEIAGCETGTSVPPKPIGSIKVTGGGQIPIDSGSATFGFNAQPDKKGGAKGHFNYVNHVTGLHINGKVDNIVVIEVNLDNTPKTVLFSGTYDGGSFIVTVQDNGEPGKYDQFGVTVSGNHTDIKSQRVISKGNIQFHKK